MPLFNKKIKLSTSQKKTIEKNSAPNMDKVEKWLDDVEPETNKKSTRFKPKPKSSTPLDEEELIEKEDIVKKPVVKSKEKIVKRKTKIGFRRPEKKPKKEKIPEETEPIEVEDAEEKLIENIVEEAETLPPEEDEEKRPFISKKKKPIIKKDMKGKPVYLEDTGEKLGTVFDTIYDKENNLVGYKIKDQKSDAILSFPSDQFDFEKEGLIFIPGWYNNAVKTIEKLEFKDKISPDLTALLSEDEVANEELYEIFVKHDDEMANYIEDAASLKEMLNNRLRLLERQRLAIKNNLIDLTEKRLIKDIDRREFSEEVMEHRRKVNILDLNISKCKNLIKRLDGTSFGVLGKINIMPEIHDLDTKQKEKPYERMIEENKQIYHTNIGKISEDPYKEKYFALKAQYEQLEDDFKDLKIAVDKLFNNDEL